MTEILGSSYSTVKATVADQLGARPGLSNVAVSYEPPVDPLNVDGIDGSRLAIWIADAEGNDDNVVMGAPGLWIDETYRLTLVLQALPRDTDDDQRVTDRRVDLMLGQLLAHTATAPHWGITEFVHVIISRGGWRRLAGPIEGTEFYPSRCEFFLDVEARLRFEGD